MSGSPLPRRFGLCLLPALALPLSGCTLLPDPPETAAQECDHAVSATSGEEVDGHLVVMFDRSASLWQTDGGVLDPAEEMTALLADESFYTSSGERLVSLGLFDGTGARASFQSWRLPPSDLMESLVEADREEFTSCLREDYLPEDLATGPLSEGSDVMSALADGEGRLATVSPSGLRRLVVVTDGRSNSGCMDLTELTDEWSAATEVAEEAVRVCRSTGEWPESDLEGVEVVLTLRKNSQEGDSRQGDAWLSDLWGEICANSSASCEVTPYEGLDGAETLPEELAPDELPDDPPVVVPAWSEPCQVQELEGDLLFPHDSATAHPEAAELLDALADHNRACADRTVTVTGHTDSQGGGAYNDALSLDRAEFVADRLRGHGFTDVVAVGAGEREPLCPGDYDDNDDVDDPCPASNRRVVVDFSEEEA